MAKIAKIERVSYRGWVYGIDVAEDESFVANGIVVHNCQEGVNQDAKFDIIKKAAPPREGLVPQSGDPEHPVRWIKPKASQSQLGIGEYAFEGGRVYDRMGDSYSVSRLSFVEMATYASKMDRETVQAAFKALERGQRRVTGVTAVDYQAAKKALIARAEELGGIQLEKAVRLELSDTDLLKYLAAFKALFCRYHPLGKFDLVLYDRATGEVIEPEDDAELVEE